jgi:hypothetical protein|nr:hypothetical protein [Kofleriaceae bacterium]
MRELWLAIAVRLGDDAARVLARVEDGVAARELSRGGRAAVIAAWRAPVPPGVARVHASWLEAAVAELPARARAAIAGDRALDDVDAWLARSACADIPPMADAGEPADPLAWLASIGADQVAFALGDAAARAESALVRAAAARIAQPPRAGRLGTRRGALARCRVPDDDLRLPRIGARAVAPHLDAVAQRRLVLRLPHAIGLAIAGELRAHAGDPIAEAPAVQLI